MQWQSDINAASQKIKAFVRKTPVIAGCDLGIGIPIDLKLEHLQHTGSFKPRGAFFSLLTDSSNDRSVVAASGGNHGAAVAFAAQALGHNATIFVPEIAGAAKLKLIRQQGAECHLVPGAYADALQQAEAFEKKHSALSIHAYDAEKTVIGQGTLAAEWDQQGLDADTILIAVGGGGLLAGALAWWGQKRRIVAVEPVRCSSLNSALKANNPIDVAVSGIAANALGAKRIGQICFELVKDNDTHSVLVTDDAIASAQELLWQQLRQYVEPAGATALAALTSGAYQPRINERVAVLICGGNPKRDPFASD